jgi:hypothetical protein
MKFLRLLERRFLARTARREASLDVDSIEDHVIASLGPRPVFDPVGNPVHARVAADLQRAAEIEEWRADLREQEDLRTGYISVPAGTAVLSALYIIEVLGCVLILRSLGFPNPERLLFGLGLAALIFTLTAAVVHHPRWWSLALYGLLVLGVTIVRLGEVAGEDGTVGEELAGGVLLLFVTVGPAFLAELLFRRLSPAVRGWREVGKLRRRLRAAERARQRAQKYVERLGREQVAWEHEAERRRHLYRQEQRRVQAERQQSNRETTQRERRSR